MLWSSSSLSKRSKSFDYHVLDLIYPNLSMAYPVHLNNGFLTSQSVQSEHTYAITIYNYSGE